jgi:RNA polymerase sigma-70 factor (ECF subfamily)
MNYRGYSDASQIVPDYEWALLECAAGREDALADIYTAERQRLVKFASRIVRDRDDADDVIHDAFIQIIRDAHDFDPARGSARGWAYAIVRNTALKRRKRAGREVAMEDGALQELRERESPGATDARMAEYASLRTILETLDPKRRASLILAIVDGRTHVEIAAYLKVPVGTVKAWIRRELVALRERLK